MQVHSLDIEDFYEDNYTLIGIHTALEDFKLAYLLNNNLDTLFSDESSPCRGCFDLKKMLRISRRKRHRGTVLNSPFN